MKLILIFSIFFFFSLEQIKSENITKINDFHNVNNRSNEIKETILAKIRKLAQEEEPVLGSSISFIIDFVSFVTDFLGKEHFADLKNEKVEKCLYEGIIENLKNKELLETCIRGSGKSLNDFGNEFECESSFQSEAEYFTLQFYLEDANTLRSEEDKVFFDFLEQHYFYIGLCIPKKCNDAVKYLLRNKTTLDLLYKRGHLSNFTLYYKDEFEKDNEIVNRTTAYEIALDIFIVFCLLKLVIGIIRIIRLNKGYQSLIKNQLDIGFFMKEENKNNEEAKNNSRKGSLLTMKLNASNNELSEIYNRQINGSFNSNDNLDLYNPFNDNIKKLPFYIRVIKALDLFDNINILVQLSNKYYNSHNLKSLYLIRFILMIMSIIYQLVFAQMELPYRGFINAEFYKDLNFIFIKLCMNASTFWITLDAVLIGYKIMSFIKKEINLSKNKRLNFFNLSKILLLVIPKFVVFLISFICFHLYGRELTLQICKKTKVYSSFLYYRDMIQSKTYTSKEYNNNFKNLASYFIPFYLNYLDLFTNIPKNNWTISKLNNDTNLDQLYGLNNNSNNSIIFYDYEISDFEVPSPFLTNSNLFVNVYFNEFYLLIIMILIAYLSYILRNKIFDYSIFIINVILFFLPIFDLNKQIKKGEQPYSLRYALGQNYTEKYTHYFINFFYFGFIIGVMKFYLDENKLKIKNKNKISSLHLPFEFCSKIIVYVNKLKFYFKRIILILSFIIIVIFSSISFKKMTKNVVIESEEEKKKEYLIYNENKSSFYYFFLFEKNLNGIFFFIILTIYIVYPKNKNIIKLAETQGFVILERISFCFYCCLTYIIYAQFSIFIIYFQISYLNIYLNILGMFLIICSVSILNTTVFELPLRQLIKFFMNKDIEKKIEIIYSENLSKES